MRDDRGESRIIKAVIESDESLSVLSSHSHILEVHGVVTTKVAVPEKDNRGVSGFLEVSESEATKYLSPKSSEDVDESITGSEEQAGEEEVVKPNKKK